MANNYYSNPYSSFGSFDAEDETNLAKGIGASNMGTNYSWSKDNAGLANRYSNLADQWNTRYGLYGTNALTANQIKDVDDVGGLGGITETLAQGKGTEKSWFGNTMDFMGGEQGNNLLGNITMGANLLTKAFMLPTAIKNMELQNKALDKNIEIAQYGLDKSRGFSNALAAAQNNQGLAARSVA